MNDAPTNGVRGPVASVAEPVPERRRLILSGHQPVYLPGIILLNKIALSDVFMFVGHCQFVKKSWHSRNRIRLANQELWLTVPVKTSGRFEQAINETLIVESVWKRKHLGSIRQAYQKAPFFKTYYPELEDRLLAFEGNLGDLNIGMIKMVLHWLEIRTRVVDSRDYEIRGAKTDMLIAMCRAVGADGYLSNEGSRDYVDEQQMADAGIQHCWQIFEHPVYAQHETFMPNMSVIDLMFHAGPEAKKIVNDCGKVQPGKCTPAMERA